MIYKLEGRDALEQEKNFFLQIRITRPETFKEDDFILKDFHES